MPMSKEHKAEYNKNYYQEHRLGILKPIQIPKPVQPEAPFYNPSIHKAGDRVRIWQNGKQIEVIVPSLS